MELRPGIKVDDQILGEFAHRHAIRKIAAYGSVLRGDFEQASDIDLLVHFVGDDQQRECLTLWLDGWSRCLSEMNYLRTGRKTTGLLDVHIVTDEDTAARTGYAAKIDAVTDPARPLPLAKS